MKLLSKSKENTQKIGQDIGKKLNGGEVIFLSGVLGAGKTVLVRGIASALGVKAKIPSPTFNIFRVYDCDLGKFYHFDCYRLCNYGELKNLSWEEIIREKNSVVVLEWPECIIDTNITKFKAKKTISVDIKIEGNNKRLIKIKTYK
jgi:tRNA threonylcarbamoyladenosine biosynthesis protein TsaE